MTIASRLYAGLAALALVLAGVATVAPSPAKAQSETTTALIAGALITVVIVSAVVLLDDEDEDEGPQSP